MELIVQCKQLTACSGTILCFLAAGMVGPGSDGDGCGRGPWRPWRGRWTGAGAGGRFLAGIVSGESSSGESQCYIIHISGSMQLCILLLADGGARAA